VVEKGGLEPPTSRL